MNHMNTLVNVLEMLHTYERFINHLENNTHRWIDDDEEYWSLRKEKKASVREFLETGKSSPVQDKMIKNNTNYHYGELNKELLEDIRTWNIADEEPDDGYEEEGQ